MPLRWEGLDRLILTVVDQSGSMNWIKSTITQGCLDLQASARSSKIPVHFVAFSEYTGESENIEDLRSISGGTRIALAFRRARQLLGERGFPKQVDVVFISDGEDEDMPYCKRELDGMSPIQCRSRLFCVGVRADFPTNLVADHIYPKFGRDSDLSSPPVLPLESVEEAPAVFKQLWDLLRAEKAPTPPDLGDIAEGMTPAELTQSAIAAYNACMHGCLFKKSCPELESLLRASAIISRIMQHVMILVIKAKGSRGQRRSMPSDLLAMEEASEVTPTKAMRVVDNLRRKLKDCLEKARRSEFMSSLDNNAKRNVAGFAGRYGAHALKAIRYHGANDRQTCEGFAATLRAYQGSPEDASLEDEISASSLEEILLDAKGVLPQLESSVSSIVGILSKVPLLGRTLTIQPPTDGAEMNPWLVEVVGMPTFVKLMTTYDLLHTPPEVLNMRANRTVQAAPAAVRPPPAAARPAALPLLSRETDPEFFEIIGDFDMNRPESPSDVRLALDIEEVMQQEERVLQSQATDGLSWGGVEEFSGYLTEYEDDEEGGGRTPPHKRDPRARRDPPPETINHLLLLPGSAGGGPRPGWMHHAATYLLLRNETLFYFDAWMGTMAATVTYLLEQPDVTAGWVQAELARVAGAYERVYRNDNASHFTSEYLGAVADMGKFRRALVTQSDSLPAALRCPHLTKPIFAMWVLIQVAGVRFEAEELRARQLALLIEFFHRAGQTLAWDCRVGRAAKSWLAEQALDSVRSPLSYGATLPEARRKYLRRVQECLRGLKPEEVAPAPRLDAAAAGRARHYQFTMDSIGRAFVGLARLSGIQGYRPDLTEHRLARVLQVAGIRDNVKRSEAPFFAAKMPEEEFKRRGGKKALGLFRAAAIVWADSEFSYEYKHAVVAAHRSPARTVPEGHAGKFHAKWGIDVGSKLGLRPCGLSSVACMSPECPHFLLPMTGAKVFSEPTTSAGEARISCRLWLHLEPVKVVPGLHKAVQTLIRQGRSDDQDSRDVAAISVIEASWLSTEPPIAAKLRAKMARDLANLEKRQIYSEARKRELRATIETYFRTQMASEERGYTSRLRERVRESILHHGDAANDAVRHAWVSKQISDITRERSGWAYDDFEAAVLASPLVRSQETGRFCVVARP